MSTFRTASPTKFASRTLVLARRSPLQDDPAAREVRQPLRHSHHLTDRSSHSPNHRVHQLRAQRPNRTSSQEIVIDRCDLFTEDHAVVAQPAGACGQSHVRRAHVTCGEDGDDNQVVPHSISDVFRDDDRRSRLMRVIWLTRREHIPDLTTSGHCRCRSASLAQVTAGAWLPIGGWHARPSVLVQSRRLQSGRIELPSQRPAAARTTAATLDQLPCCDPDQGVIGQNRQRPPASQDRA